MLHPMVMGSHAAQSCSRAVGSSVGNDEAASSTSTWWPPSSMAASSRRGSAPRLCVPKTTSKCGSSSTSFSPSRCPMQPPTATTRFESGVLARSGMFLREATWPYRRVSAASRTQQVMKATMSASSTDSTWRAPMPSSMPAMRSESCLFIWHPNVRRQNVRFMKGVCMATV